MGPLAHWLARRALRGFPAHARDAALANDQIRRVVRVRFAYFFAVHGAVVFLLLKAISGGDAWTIVSFGLASLIMVPGEIVGGVLADRHGPKWALRVGMRLMSALMLAFAALLVARALSVDDPTATGHWPPGVVGICVLELAIGVALSLINGADTVLFVAVARDCEIEDLDASAFEGVGSALRYHGTLIAVAIGVALYYGIEALVPDPRLALALQGTVFLGTFIAQAYALSVLRGVREPPAASTRRVGARQLLEAAGSLRIQPTLLRAVAGTAVVIGAAQFAIYYFQSPLESVVDARGGSNPAWYGGYAIAIMVGYWTSVAGSKLFARIRAGGRIPIQRGNVPLLLCTFFALLLFPAAWAGFGGVRSPLGDGLYFATCALALVACGALRGLFEPWARTALVEFSRRYGLGMPTALVSAFNAAIRVSHFLIATAVGGLIGASAVHAGLAQVATALTWASLIVGALLVAVGIGAWLLAGRRGRLDDLPKRCDVVVIGSYKDDMDGLLGVCRQLQDAGHRVLHPPPAARVTGQDGEFVRLASDPSTDEGEVQRRVFALMERSDVIVAWLPGGKVGVSTAMEIGYALASGRPVATVGQPQDVTLQRLLPGPHDAIVEHIR